MNPLRKISNKINFELGQNPRIEKAKDYKRFIPAGYRSVLLVYADFELAWAWRFSKNSNISLKQFAKRERENVPAILRICGEFNIPVTWATVGHLFLGSCVCENDLPHNDMKRPQNFENEYWDFLNGDWYQHDPCTDYKMSPEWYCPDLIKTIIDSEQNHEIACHTFSHIDCREKYCSKELISSELEKCVELAEKMGLKLKTFVHPAHTIGNLSSLSEYNFTSYRTDYGNILGYPFKNEHNLWQIKSTWEFAYFPYWDADYHIYRYCEIINRAIENNTLCVFWFHPSIDNLFVSRIMPEIFKYADERRDEIFISNVSGYIDSINAE